MSESQEYYNVECDNRGFGDRWHLSEPVDIEGKEIDAREFTGGRHYHGPTPVNVPIQYTGRQAAFNLAAFDMPVVTEQIADIIEGVAPDSVERFPVLIDSSMSGYEILNVTKCIKCLDERRSKIEWWTEDDGRPDKIGKYRIIIDMKIDPSRAGGFGIFRIDGWKIALVVNDRLKMLLDRVPDLGVRFDLLV